MATRPTYFSFGESNSYGDKWIEKAFDAAYDSVSQEEGSLIGLPSSLDYHEWSVPMMFPAGESHCKPHVYYGVGSLCTKCWKHVGLCVLFLMAKKKHRKRRWERGR